MFLEESDFKIFSSAPIKPLSDAVECGDRDFFFEDVPCENHKGGLSQNRLKTFLYSISHDVKLVNYFCVLRELRLAWTFITG